MSSLYKINNVYKSLQDKKTSDYYLMYMFTGHHPS
jgi:hypothetical protein